MIDGEVEEVTGTGLSYKSLVTETKEAAMVSEKRTKTWLEGVFTYGNKLTL